MNKVELAEALIAIADSGSIHKAAIKLCQTDAAISKKLSKLEEYLEVQLIQRSRKGLLLTDAGQRYYHEIKKALNQFNLAEQCLIEERQEPQGELRVTLNPYYTQTMIMPKLGEFLKRYPKILLTLDVSEVLPDFNAKKMDILWGTSLLGEEQLVRKKICETHYVLCASPQYIKGKGMPHTISELLQHDIIVHAARKPPYFISFKNNQKLIIEPILLVNNSQAMVQAALEHIGLFWSHEYVVEKLVAQKKLIYILPDEMEKSKPVYAFYEFKIYKDPKIKAFIDFYS